MIIDSFKKNIDLKPTSFAQDQEVRFQTLIESLGHGIIFCDRDDIILHVNTRMGELVGYPPEELIGKRAEVVLLPPNNQDGFREKTARRLQGISEQYEIQLIRKDGSLFWTLFDATPIFDGAGAIVGTLCALTDITDRRAAEQQLRESEERFRLMADTAPVMIWGAGVNKRCNYLNKVWLDFTGKSLEEGLGDEWAAGIHPDDVGSCLKNYYEAFDARKEFKFSYRLQRYDGEYRWVLDHCVPTYDQNGVFTGYIGSCVDITDQKRSEEEVISLHKQLLQSQKMEAIGQLAAGVAHDLNNALAAVAGHLQLIETSEHLAASLRHSVETALAGCKRALSCIDHLLGFSRQKPQHLQTTSLRKIVYETIDFLAPVIGNELNICCVGMEDSQLVRVDQGQIQQAITNLALNAKHAMPYGGAVTFGFSRVYVTHPERQNPDARPGFYIVLSVSDTGCGIAPEHLDKIFEPFFTTKSVGQGTGLGLPMVYNIMQNHNGWIEVTTGLNRGSTFSLYFPEALPVLSERVVATGQKSIRGVVLVIDDEPELVELARMFLKQAGLDPVGFSAPEQALTWYQSHYAEVDFIILDMKMPEMDGGACFERLLRINPRARAVMLSGYFDERVAEALLSKGVLKLFQKPLKYPELVNWVAEQIRKGRDVPQLMTTADHGASALSPETKPIAVI